MFIVSVENTVESLQLQSFGIVDSYLLTLRKSIMKSLIKPQKGSVVSLLDPSKVRQAPLSFICGSPRRGIIIFERERSKSQRKTSFIAHSSGSADKLVGY